MHPMTHTASRLTPHAARHPQHGLSQPAFLALLLAVALVAGFGGFAFYQMSQAPEPSPARAELQRQPHVLGMPRPHFSLPDLGGETRHVSDWDGDVVLVNFWATWCPPCLKEMPAFVEMQEAYGDQGLTILAVAIDDEEAVREFAETHGLNFPVLLGESDGMGITRDYGNRMGALPYSALLDREGRIRFIQAGELHKDVFERELRPLL
jgi:peroxiredoxin